jgi:ribonucleoside-diphosphate reductase alpha chain
MSNERIDSRDIISDYIFYSKYSRVKPDGKKETWPESVSRVMEMHYEFFNGKIKDENKDAFNKVFQEAWSAYYNQEVLGSQRSLQYGGPQLLKNNFRSFNCSGSYCNRIEFFQELMELLLSGCVPADTPILTENGIKRFDEVKVGEKVWSYNKEKNKQEFKSVIATHDVIVKSEDQIKISGSSGYFITSKKHPVLILREGKWEYLPAGQIKIGDIIRKGLFDKSNLEFNEKAYFVGSFLGDGSVYKSPKGNLTIKMGGDNKEVIEAFASFCSKYSDSSFNVRLNKTDKYSVPFYETDNTISAKNKLARDWNKLIGVLPGNKVNVIDAPEWIKKSYDKSIILSFLAGLIDTDGWIGKEDGRICYSTVSEKMKNFLMEYLPMFNIYPWCFVNKAETYTYGGFKPNYDIYTISFSLNGDDCFYDFVSFIKHPLKREKLLSIKSVRATKKIAIPYEFLKREADYLFDEERDRKKNRSGFIYHASEQMFVKCAYYYNRQKSYKHLIEYDRVIAIEDDLGLDENFKDITVEDNHSYIVGYGGQFVLHNCGTGYSIQKVHIKQLPIVKGIDNSKKVSTVIEDSIEGWALSTGLLIESYYKGLSDIEFDYSHIRPEGALVSGGFKAPGPEPLKVCHDKLRKILSKAKGRKLRPFELHLMSCIIADAVISGGIRRSAMISIFDIDDEEMLQCKTGDWFLAHPELCRCNNSVAIYEDTPKEKYDKIFEYIKQYGEPGLLFMPDTEAVINPCAEALLYPTYTNPDGSKEYGFSFCNLCEINGKKVKTEEDFYKACRAAAILGTFQAAYTENLPLLSEATRKIMKRDALLGVGITGMADNPNILFNERIQRKGARIIKEVNKEVAAIIGINTAARTTVIKPSGNASQLLGCGSGIHAYHFRKYIRNIQANNNEQALKEVIKLNPDIANPSFWNKKGETVLSFPIELDDETTVRTDFSTLDFLYRIYTTEKGWIMEGTNTEHPSSIAKPKYHHNVSCTVSVKEDEWSEIADWIWEHKDGFCGLSFLPETGDLDYPQAPYTSYLDEKELADTYGQGAILSSGLIVDGLQVFGDIWTACNAATGKANDLLIYTDDYLLSFIKKHIKDGKLLVTIDGLCISDVNAISSYLQHKIEMRNDWVRRFKKFSKNYFEGDDEKCSRCLKHVNIFHQWQKIKNQKPIDWENVEWEQEYKNVGENVATACAGGSCELR